MSAPAQANSVIVHFSTVMDPPTLLPDFTDLSFTSTSILTVQVATDDNVKIPVHFHSSFVHQSAITKFRFLSALLRPTK